MKIIKKIKINLATYIFIILFLFSGYKSNLLYLLLVFLIHELGHVFFCKLFNIRIQSIEIFPYGGVIKLNHQLNVEIYKEFFISAGGILFQVVFEIINIIYFRNHLFSYFNIAFLKINLIPIIPFDGHKIIWCFFSKYLPFFYAKFFSLILSILFLVILFFYELVFIKINIVFIIFSLCFTFKEIKMINYVINRFYLERLLSEFKFLKTKYHSNKNLKLIKRNVLSFFLDEEYVHERVIIAKKFDNSSYIW